MNRVKENIKLYLPAIIKIVGDDFDWDRIDKLFTGEINKRIEKAKEETLIIDVTIYDIIIEVKKGNKEAKRFLSFFQRLLEELSINLSLVELKLIKKNIRDFLTRFDQKYLDYVGELAVINNLIKSKTYRLENIETKLISGKSIDFEIKNIENGQPYFVEVTNIHLVHEKVENDDEKIEAFLNHRLTSKINSKMSDINFYLIPVLWGGWRDIKIYSDYFMRNKMHISSVLEPLAYVTFYDPKKETFYLHRFTSVSKLFETTNLIIYE